jgi:antirestriction protein
LMFQDWEYIPTSLISESWLSEKTFEYIENNLLDNEPFCLWVDNLGYNLHAEAPSALAGKFNVAYVGSYQSELDYASQLADEMIPPDAPELLFQYFNYEAYSRDLFMGDYTFINGYVFRN